MQRFEINGLMLTLPEALALGRFVKRVGWQEIRLNARTDDECDLMYDAIGQLYKTLVTTGHILH